MVAFAHSVWGCEDIAFVNNIAAFCLTTFLCVEKGAVSLTTAASCCVDHLAFAIHLFPKGNP